MRGASVRRENRESEYTSFHLMNIVFTKVFEALLAGCQLATQAQRLSLMQLTLTFGDDWSELHVHGS